jgi:hypothetical protein
MFLSTWPHKKNDSIQFRDDLGAALCMCAPVFDSVSFAGGGDLLPESVKELINDPTSPLYDMCTSGGANPSAPQSLNPHAHFPGSVCCTERFRSLEQAKHHA